MITPQKLQANRENTRASTGPRSAAGKARSARNAHRHGLAIPVWSDCALAADAEALAHKIAGAGASPELLALARRIAEPQIDLVRVRKVHHDLIARIFDDPVPVLATQAAAMRRARALIRIDKLLDKQLPIPSELRQLVERPEESEKFSLFTSNVARSLAAMDRYERRALSRRKAAIRAFDEAPRA